MVNDPDHVRIHITDHGEGISETFLPHLFDRFSRADTGMATTKPGTGLGLYFVRQLAHASGLTIDQTTPRGHLHPHPPPRLTTTTNRHHTATAEPPTSPATPTRALCLSFEAGAPGRCHATQGPAAAIRRTRSWSVTSRIVCLTAVAIDPS